MALETDGFCAHDWGLYPDYLNHGRVAIIYEELAKLGLNLWFDKLHMVGNLRDKMTQGIERTNCLLAFITSRYQEKVNLLDPEDNCYFEFNFACFRLTSKRIIPIVMDPEMKNTKKWKGRLASELATHLYVDMTEAIMKYEAGEGDQLLKDKCQEIYELILKIKNNSILVPVNVGNEGKKFIQLTSELDWIKPFFETIEKKFHGVIVDKLRHVNNLLSNNPIMNKLLQSLDFDKIILKILGLTAKRMDIMATFLLILPEAEGELIETVFSSFLNLLKSSDHCDSLLRVLTDCKVHEIIEYIYGNLDSKTNLNRILEIKLRVKTYNLMIQLSKKAENIQIFLSGDWNLFTERDDKMMLSKETIKRLATALTDLTNDDSLDKTDFNRFDDDLVALLCDGWRNSYKDGDVEFLTNLNHVLQFLFVQWGEPEMRYQELKCCDLYSETITFYSKDLQVYAQLIVDLMKGMKQLDFYSWLVFKGEFEVFPKLILDNKTNVSFLRELYWVLVDSDSSEVVTEDQLLSRLILHSMGENDYTPLWETYKEILKAPENWKIVLALVEGMEEHDHSSFINWIGATDIFTAIILKNLENNEVVSKLLSIITVHAFDDESEDCSPNSRFSTQEKSVHLLLLLLNCRNKSLYSSEIWLKLKDSIRSIADKSGSLSLVLPRISYFTEKQSLFSRSIYRESFHELILDLLKVYKSDSKMIAVILDVFVFFLTSRTEKKKLNDLHAMRILLEICIEHRSCNEISSDLHLYLFDLVSEDTSTDFDEHILGSVTSLLDYYSKNYSREIMSDLFTFLKSYIENKDFENHEKNNYGRLLKYNVPWILIENSSRYQHCKIICFILRFLSTKSAEICRSLKESGLITMITGFLTRKNFQYYTDEILSILTLINCSPLYVETFCLELDEDFEDFFRWCRNSQDLFQEYLKIIFNFLSGESADGFTEKLRNNEFIQITFYDCLVKYVTNKEIVELGLKIFAKLVNAKYLQSYEICWDLFSKIIVTFPAFISSTYWAAVVEASIKDQNNQTVNDIYPKFMKAGCTVKALMRIGLTQDRLNAIMSQLSLQQRIEAGMSAKDLKDQSLTLIELRESGFSDSELKDAGFDIEEFRSAGYTAEALKTVGFLLKDLKEYFQLNEIIGMGYLLSELKEEGYSVSNLKPFFSVSDFLIGNYDIADLVRAGFTLQELSLPGVSAEQFAPMIEVSTLSLENSLQGSLLSAETIKKFAKELYTIPDLPTVFSGSSLLYRSTDDDGGPSFSHFNERSTGKGCCLLIVKVGNETWGGLSFSTLVATPEQAAPEFWAQTFKTRGSGFTKFSTEHCLLRCPIGFSIGSSFYSPDLQNMYTNARDGALRLRGRTIDAVECWQLH
jgi:hypothetical protein